MNSSFYLSIPLMAFLAILQATVLPRFPISGLVPQLLLLAVLSWGLLRGLRPAMLWAFVGGLFLDLFSAGPIGVSIAALMAAVASARLIQRAFPESRVLLPVLLAALSTLVYWLVSALLLRLLMPLIVSNTEALGIAALARGTSAPGLLADIGRGYRLGGPLLTYTGLAAALHALLILPVYWAFLALDRLANPPRVEI